VLLMASVIALQVKDGAGALSMLRRAAALAPQDTNIRIGLGLAQLTTGNASEAAATWRPVIEICDDPEILLDMMKLYHLNGDSEAEQRAMARLRATGGMP
jgi:Flp pilus assembly protein TadD